MIGSNSFSGSDFINLLLENPENEVIGVTRSPEKPALFLRYKRHINPRFRFYQMDLNRDLPLLLEMMDRERPAYVVHFAALLEPGYSWQNPEQWFQTNVMSLVRLANHLKNQSYLERYMHISTPEVYGSCQGVVKEDAPLNPTTPYAASKAAGDLFLFTLVKAFSFPMVMIRSTNVYGAYQQLFRIIPRSIISLKSGQRIPLHGGGVAVKSYIHIRDVSRGELAALHRGQPGSIYHLSPDYGIAVRDLVRLICDRMGKRFEEATTTVEERLGQDAAYVIDSSRARQELGWLPCISLEEGLDEIATWIERYWDEIRLQPLEYEHRF